MKHQYFYRPHYALNSIRVEADEESAWVLDKISMVDGDPEIMLEPDPKVQMLTVKIHHRKENQYEVEMEGHDAEVTQHPLYVVLAYIKSYALMLPEYFGMHAATVEYKNKVHVFMAATGTGKTSLAAYLCSRGAKLYGDDLTLIRRENLMVYPSQKSVMLREPSLNLLKEYGIDLTGKIQPVYDGEYDRYQANFPLADEIRKMDAMYVIRIGEEHSIHPVEDERQRMQYMMLNALRHEKFTMEYLRFMQEMSRIPMYEMQYRNFDWVLEQL